MARGTTIFQHATNQATKELIPAKKRGTYRRKLNSQIEDAYAELGVQNEIGFARKLISEGLIDPTEMTAGLDATRIASLLPWQRAVMDYITTTPPEELTDEGIIKFEKEFHYREGGKNPLDVIAKKAGATTRLQLMMMYDAFNKAPESNKKESLSPTSIMVLKLSLLGYTQKEINRYLNLGTKEDVKPGAQTVPNWIFEQQAAPAILMRLVKSGELDPNELTDDRNLLRIRFISDAEREIINPDETQSKPHRWKILAQLTKKFGVRQISHLKFLYNLSLILYPEPVSPVTEIPRGPLIGTVITPMQGEVFKLEAAGLNRDQIATRLSIGKDTLIRITNKALTSLKIKSEISSPTEAKEKSNRDHILAINELVKTGEIDPLKIITANTTTLELAKSFNGLTPVRKFVLDQLMRGETSSSIAANLPGGPSNVKAVNVIISRIYQETGTNSRIHLVVAYHAFKSLPPDLIPKPEIPVGDPATLGVEVLKRYASGQYSTIHEAISSTGHPPDHYMLTSLYRQRSFSNQYEAIQGLIASGEINIKELAKGFDFSAFDQLTARELQLFSLISQGVSQEQIAQDWKLNLATVNQNLHRAMTRTGISSLGQLASFYHLYQYPENPQTAAQSPKFPIDLVGTQSARLRLKGIASSQIAKVLNISQEQLADHENQVSVALGTNSEVETLIELQRLGRLDTTELTKNVNLYNFTELNELQIGTLEALVCKDPVRFLSYQDKMAHYLRISPAQAKEDLLVVQAIIGLTPNITNALQRVRTEINETKIAATSPPTEKQTKFAHDFYNKYHKNIRSYLRKSFESDDVIDELLQQIFETAYRNIDKKIIEDSNIPRWLSSLSRHYTIRKNNELAAPRTLNRDYVIANASITPKEYGDEEDPENRQIFNSPDKFTPYDEISSAELIKLRETPEFQNDQTAKLAILYMEYRKKLRALAA